MHSSFTGVAFSGSPSILFKSTTFYSRSSFVLSTTKISNNNFVLIPSFKDLPPFAWPASFARAFVPCGRKIKLQSCPHGLLSLTLCVTSPADSHYTLSLLTLLFNDLLHYSFSPPLASGRRGVRILASVLSSQTPAPYSLCLIRHPLTHTTHTLSLLTFLNVQWPASLQLQSSACLRAMGFIR